MIYKPIKRSSETNKILINTIFVPLASSHSILANFVVKHPATVPTHTHTQKSFSNSTIVENKEWKAMKNENKKSESVTDKSSTKLNIKFWQHKRSKGSFAGQFHGENSDKFEAQYIAWPSSAKYLGFFFFLYLGFWF